MSITHEDVTEWGSRNPQEFSEIVAELGFSCSRAEWGRKLEAQYRRKEEELAAEFALNRRDQLAMAALTGLLSNAEAVNSEGWSWRTGTLAGDAYKFADDMLEARKQESVA